MPESSNPHLQIAACDDEPTDCRQTSELIRGIMAAEGLSCNLSAYGSAAALLAAIQNGAQPGGQARGNGQQPLHRRDQRRMVF